MKSSPLRIALPGGLVLAVAILSGCQSGSLSKLTPTLPNSITRLWGADNEVRWADKDNPAVRCICLWQPADGTWEGRPSRGFGGQVFFLDRKTARPIAVKGDVRIHVFDNFGPRKDHGKPVHTFDFTKGAWNAFLVKTQFGPAYNIFVPYTRPGYHKTEGAVRVRLAGNDVPTVFSDMSYVKLEGTNEKSNSTETFAANDTKKRPTPTDSIGQISRKHGVTPASVNRFPSQPEVPEQAFRRGLSPELEARLAKLKQKRQIKKYTPTGPGLVEGPAAASAPDFDGVPEVRTAETKRPRRFAVPASAKPILQNTQTPSTRATPHPLDANSTTPARRTLAPSHPLEGPSASHSPMIPMIPMIPVNPMNPMNPMNPAAGPSAWAGATPLAPQASNPHEEMIREAEAAAAGHDFSQAIRLASKVDRAVRREQLSWPLDRPTPSALVAQWEVQRIDMAAAGDVAQRTSRIDSRVDDYLKASQAQVDKNQTAEARRLATVAHLVSRAATASGAVTPVGAVEIPAATATRRVSTADWNQPPTPAKPARSARSAHPLEAASSDE